MMNCASLGRIFLSGTMRGNWTDKVKKELSSYSFYDPKNHGLKTPSNYTRWDLGMISNSILVFAYMNKENPSGIGLSLEIGFARGIGVPVVLVLEPREQEQGDARYWEIVRSTSDFCFAELDRAIEFVKENGVHNLSWGGVKSEGRR